MTAAAILEPLLALMLKPLLDGSGDFLVSRENIPYFAAAVLILLPLAMYGRAYLGGWLDITMQRDLRREMAAKLVRRPQSDSEKNRQNHDAICRFRSRHDRCVFADSHRAGTRTIKNAFLSGANVLSGMATRANFMFGNAADRDVDSLFGAANEKKGGTRARRNGANAKPPQRIHRANADDKSAWRGCCARYFGAGVFVFAGGVVAHANCHRRRATAFHDFNIGAFGCRFVLCFGCIDGGRNDGGRCRGVFGAVCF